MSTPRVLIIGASARATAESARRAGWDVIASDMFGDVDLRRVADFVAIENYPDDFASLMERSRLPVIYTGGMENHPEVLEKADVIWGNRGEPLRKVRDPFWWTDALSETSIRLARVTLEMKIPSRPMFLTKPLNGSGGYGVSLLRDEVAQDGYYFQEQVNGRSMAAIFVAADGRAELCGVIENQSWRNHPHTKYAYGGSLGPFDTDPRETEQLQIIGNTLARKAGLRGIFGVDFISHEQDGAVPIEINPRYTASVEVLEIANGVSLLEAHYHACVNNTLVVPEPTQAMRVVKAIVYAAEQIVVPEDFERQDLPKGARMADVPGPGTVIEAANPLCTLIATGPTVGKALAKLVALTQRVHPNASSFVDVLS